MDTEFVKSHHLPVIPVNPIELKLFNGTSNSVITQSLDLPVIFPTGESMLFNFYVTPLNLSCSMVLGYNWLTCYNSLIDWVLGSITFWLQLLDPLSLPLTSSARAAKISLQNSSVSNETLQIPNSIPCISLIGAATFVHACKLLGTQSFSCV